MPFDSFDSVDAWVAKKGANGAEALRERLDANRFAGNNERWARAWLARHDRQAAGERLTVEDDRAERTTVAAQIQAAAAVDANRLAKWAIWISIITALSQLMEWAIKLK